MNRLTWMLTLTVLLTGCDIRPTQAIEPKNPPAAAPAAAPAGENQAGQAVLAIVNGQNVLMARLHDALVQDYGLPIAQQIVADEVVRQELIAQDLPGEVTPDQLRAESIRALRRIFNFVKDPSKKQLDTLLGQFLSKQRFTRRQWDTTMTRNVRLSRLAAKRIKITDKMLRTAFLQVYDGKLMVRHIQVSTLDKAQAIHKKVSAGGDFAELARKHSTNPTGKEGGLIEIGIRSPSKELPLTLVKVARTLEKTGDVSNPLQAGTAFHILKLEEILPPKNVKFEDVKAELEQFVREQEIARLQQKILRQLLSKAKTQYVNPVIRAQQEKAKRAKP